MFVEIEKRLKEAKEKKAAHDAERIEKHNAAFVEAYLKALDNADDGASFVEVNIPKVGKCLFKFPSRPDHAAFKREVNVREKPLELSTCTTYSTKCVVFPPPIQFKEMCDKYNVQGFEIAALRIHREMQEKDEEEGKD
jgi:hypothetical protein